MFVQLGQKALLSLSSGVTLEPDDDDDEGGLLVKMPMLPIHDRNYESPGISDQLSKADGSPHAFGVRLDSPFRLV